MVRFESEVRICRGVMTRKGFSGLAGVFFLASLMIPVPAHSQAWSGILDPSRAVDWSQAGFVISEPASQCSNQKGSYSPSGGDDAANINALIAGCTHGGYVLLGPGTFHFLSAGLLFNAVHNVVLRGAGPDRTKLVMSAFTRKCFFGNFVCVGGDAGQLNFYSGAYGKGNGTTWTGDNGVAGSYAKGDTVIDLGSTSGLQVGQMILLDQDDDSYGFPTSRTGCSESGSIVTCNTTIPHNFSVGDTVAVGGGAYPPKTNDCGQGTNVGYAGWWTVTAVPTSTSFQYNANTTGLSICTGGYASKDTGGLFVSDIDNVTVGYSANTGRKCPAGHGNVNPSCTATEVSRRAQVVTHVVTGIVGNQVTISPPLLMTNWRTSQRPGAFWLGTYPSQYAIGDGIENLTIDSSAQPEATGGTVEFFAAYKCWLKNVRVISGDAYHVLLWASSNIDILDNYFVGTRNGQSGTYGVDDYNAASNNLIQNNIFQHIPACMISEGGHGSVWAYNYCVDNAYNEIGWLPEAMSMNHGTSAMELFEGNDVPSCRADVTHGPGFGLTLFRSRCRGNDTPVKWQSLYAVSFTQYERGNSVVGSVLGTPGSETQYSQPSGNELQGGYIYGIGLPGKADGLPQYDSLVSSTLLRWGNYDVVTGAVRRCGSSSNTGWLTTCLGVSEIPASDVPFIHGNAVPTKGDTGIGQPPLPPSFYLSTQPAFWRMTSAAGPTPRWPAIGPDVTGGTAPDGVAGHSYSIPAQLCYQHTPIDPAYQQIYTVRGASWSSGTARLITTANTLRVDDTIVVSGISPSGYNGTWQVSAATSTTVSFRIPTNPGNYVSGGGAVAWPNILLFNPANCYAYYQSSLSNAPTKLRVISIH